MFNKNRYGFVIIVILSCLLSLSLVSATGSHNWNYESLFISGSITKDIQINLDNAGVCDADAYIKTGYDYPGNSVSALVTCERCTGIGTDGVGSSSYVPSGQDPFSDCGVVDCSVYYVQTGTESSTTTEECSDRANEPAGTHNCGSSGSCEGAASICPSNSADTLQYSCGTCKYISVSSCTGGTLGSCSNYGSGTDSGSCRECDGSGGEQAPSDDGDCGTIDCDELDFYSQSGTQSATSTETCYYRNYADIISNRCEGLGNCKDPNSGDCTSYSDQSQYTCGNCKYLDSGSCTGTTLGSCSNYGAGIDTGSCKECDGSGNERTPSDDSDCGTIDCDGLNYYFQSGAQSATTTETCYYRNYVDITSGRCEGFGDCKDSNSGDCTSYSNQNQYSCDACKYISGSSCTGSTQGSCSNYGSGTSCGTNQECDGSGNCQNLMLYNGEHTYNECLAAGGTIREGGSGDYYCRFATGSVPSGWTASNWKTIVARTCVGINYEDIYLTCTCATSCTTASDSWGYYSSSVKCSYQHCNLGPSGCQALSRSCYATISYRGYY